jgi:PTH1 family peptidyl-tRNA hydrolase
MKKFLIVGLGNIGADYENTRHNIGFKILDDLAASESVSFQTEKLGDLASFRFKGKTFLLLKPSTYMNLSGKSVKYWLDKEKIKLENLLVISDDLNLDFGTFRLKAKGSAGGHNFSKGKQSNYVLGEWSKEEKRYLPELLLKGSNLVKSFGTSGLGNTMNQFNGPLEL